MKYCRTGPLLVLACISVVIAPHARTQSGPGLTISKQNTSVRIHGNASSAANEAILRGTAARLFEENDIRLVYDQPVPPGWALLSEMTLRTVASTLSATVVIERDSVVMRGLTTSPGEFEQQLGRLRRSLLPGMALDNRIAAISRDASIEDYCRRVFDAAVRDRSIDFLTSEQRPAKRSYPLLNELVEIATDCPTARIRVIGHSDASGDESANLSLSEQRAKAVVAHMAQRGLSADRLIAIGKGSAEPIARNDNAQGRGKNRRIEFEVFFD